MERELPRGTVIFLFTDIERSTVQWERNSRGMATAVARHIELLQRAIRVHRGFHFKTVGDAVQAAFPTAPDAVAAALAAQQSLLAEDWRDIGPLRVRMALHAGEATPDERGDYLAAPLNRLSRILDAGHGGQILVSQAVRQLVRDNLPPGAEWRDLGEHRLRDLLEPERIFQLVHPNLPAEFPGLASLSSRPNNLPRQPTTFVGREAEVETLAALLQYDDVQLLTLVGAGGTGKTRLALQVASELLPSFADGVFFVSLASLSDPSLVLSTIASTLGMHEETGRPLPERVQDFLSNKQLLLVLDNFEHVAEAASVIADILRASTRLKLLATSRAPLRLRAEHEYVVHPLALPPRHTTPAPDQLERIESVRLFIERARAAKADFIFDSSNAATIAEICRRVDGLPLAIELAAARVRHFPPRTLLDRLRQRLPVLVDGPRDAPARQRTLRATIAWSVDLLQPDEQALFRRLAVFAGGCTIAACEAVANHDGSLDVFAGLERLIENSLVRQDQGEDGEPRFPMLETIREYGLEAMTAAGELETVIERHAAFFLAFAEELEPSLHGPAQSVSLARLDDESDNFRSALQWSIAHRSETALRLSVALYWFWLFRGNLTEGRSWTDRALASAETLDAPLQVKVWNVASAFALARGDYAAAATWGEKALASARSQRDRVGEGWALVNLGVAATALGDPERGIALSVDAESVFTQEDVAWGAAAAVYNQGTWVGRLGDEERQRRSYERALSLARTAGNRLQSSWILSALGHHELDRGQWDRARALLTEARDTAREFRFGLIEADALAGLARSALEQGDTDQAARWLQEAEEKYGTLGPGSLAAAGLEFLGQLALRLGDAARAKPLLAEALRIARIDGCPAATNRYLLSLASGLRASGEICQAAELLRESLQLARDTQDRTMIGESIANIAGIAADSGRFRDAAELLGVAESHGPMRKLSDDPVAAPRLDDDQTIILAAIGPATEAAAREEGRALSLPAGIDAAMKVADEIALFGQAGADSIFDSTTTRNGENT